MVERGGPTLDRAGSIHSVSLRNSARMSDAEGDDTLGGCCFQMSMPVIRRGGTLRILRVL